MLSCSHTLSSRQALGNVTGKTPPPFGASPTPLSGDLPAKSRNSRVARVHDGKALSLSPEGASTRGHVSSSEESGASLSNSNSTLNPQLGGGGTGAGGASATSGGGSFENGGGDFFNVSRAKGGGGLEDVQLRDLRGLVSGDEGVTVRNGCVVLCIDIIRMVVTSHVAYIVITPESTTLCNPLSDRLRAGGSDLSFEMEMMEFALEAVIASTMAAVNDCAHVSVF